MEGSAKVYEGSIVFLLACAIATIGVLLTGKATVPGLGQELEGAQALDVLLVLFILATWSSQLLAWNVRLALRRLLVQQEMGEEKVFDALSAIQSCGHMVVYRWLVMIAGLLMILLLPSSLYRLFEMHFGIAFVLSFLLCSPTLTSRMRTVLSPTYWTGVPFGGRLVWFFIRKDLKNVRETDFLRSMVLGVFLKRALVTFGITGTIRRLRVFWESLYWSILVVDSVLEEVKNVSDRTIEARLQTLCERITLEFTREGPIAESFDDNLFKKRIALEYRTVAIVLLSEEPRDDLLAAFEQRLGVMHSS